MPSSTESGGGIPLSGGECLLQPDFSTALLAGAHRRGINTAIQLLQVMLAVMGWP